MDGLKTQEDAVPSKDWMKTTEETNRDKGDDSSSRNCKESRYWAKAVVEKDASSIDNQHSADMAKIDLQAHPSYKGNQKSMGLLRIEVEKGPSTMDDQHSTDLMKVDLETKLSIGCEEHSIDLTQIEDEAEPPSVDDQHRTDSIKMEVEEGHDQHPTDSIKMEVEEEHDQRPTDSIKMEVEEEHVQRPTDSIKMEEEEVHDQRPTDSIKMEEEHCTVDGQQKDAGERESAARVNKGPIRWVKIEVQTCAGDNQKVAKLVKMEDADEPSSEFPQDSTDLVKLEARKETYSEVCPDSSCLMKFEEEDPLSRDSLGDMAHVKTEEFDGPFHKKSPGLIKWVMFKTEADPFSRDSQDCEGGRSDNSAAVLAELAAKEDALGVGAELVRLRHPSLFFSGEVHCNGVAKIILMKPGSAPLSRNVVKGKNPDSVLPEHQPAAVEDQYKDVAGSPDCHEDDPCSSDTESSGTTEISSTGSPDCHEDDPCSSDTESSGTGFPMIASVFPLRGTEEEKRHSAEHQKSAPCKDISCNSGSPDCHEDDPCSSDSESSGTGFPMIASVISLRGTEEEKRHSAEHQESAPRKDISCNSELPLITSVYTLRGTEDASKHQESVLRSNINCNAGVPAVSLLFIGNVLQPLMTPLNTQKGQPAVSVMTVGDQRQPLMLPPNSQGSAGVSELGAGDPSTPAMKTGSELQPVVPNANNPEGGADPSVKIVLNKLTDLPSPASTQKQERIAKPDEEFPVITSVFTLRDTEEEDLQSVDNAESKRSEDVNFDSGIPMITAVFTLRDEEELQQAKRREKVTKRKESMAQDPGNLKPEGSRKMKYSSRYQVGPGPYTCSVCGRIFVHFNLFSRHEATHKVLKHHKCPVCGDTFNQKYRLLAHKKTHTVKPRKYMPFILPKPTF